MHLSGRTAHLDEFVMRIQELKAHSLIFLTLLDEVLYEVVNEESIFGLLLKLKKLFMTNSIRNTLFLKNDCLGYA